MSTVSSRPEGRATEIALALVFRGPELLITQRPSAVHLGGLWEFPGGKRRAGESAAACAVREVQEEVGLTVCARYLRPPFEFEYPDRYLHFQPVVCEYRAGEVRRLAVADFAWILPEALSRYAFPPANARLLEQLVAESKA